MICSRNFANLNFGLLIIETTGLAGFSCLRTFIAPYSFSGAFQLIEFCWLCYYHVILGTY